MSVSKNIFEHIADPDTLRVLSKHLEFERVHFNAAEREMEITLPMGPEERSAAIESYWIMHRQSMYCFLLVCKRLNIQRDVARLIVSYAHTPCIGPGKMYLPDGTLFQCSRCGNDADVLPDICEVPCHGKSNRALCQACKRSCEQCEYVMCVSCSRFCGLCTSILCARCVPDALACTECLRQSSSEEEDNVSSSDHFSSDD